jgi:hypothetical protein
MHPWKHFRTITRHRNLVAKHCRWVGIPWQGLLHDLSKYGPTEFLAGARYYLGTRSPNEKERELFGYSEAWLHHKGRNRHHHEYWNDLNPKTKLYEPVRMPVRYVAEMFCDRVAASKIYQGDAYCDRYSYDYYLRGHTRVKLHPDTADLLESWLILLAEQGEAVAFAAVKAAVQADRAARKAARRSRS